jgi:hypothetical protein
VVLAVGGLLVYLSFSTKNYTCLTLWTAPATPAPAPSATPHVGFAQDDMGRGHVPVGSKVKYTFCPPASGQHYNAAGVAGPITAKVYGPNEPTIPQNWLHNMEHGGLVILYRCADGDTCDDAQQTALKDFFSTFPNSPICNLPRGKVGPVITRFDDMKFPYAALLWDEILPLDTFDATQIVAFFNQSAERLNPEPVCAQPTPTPGPTDTPGPTGTAAPSTEPTTAPGSPVTSSPAPTST